jgi:Polyketide cyclase / dehydrase and lipid transport
VRSLEPIEESFFRDAPVVLTNRNVLAAPRDSVFACISGDPAGWGDWFPGFSHNGRWDTAPPHGVGSRRTVDAYRSEYRETILAWDPNERWAFRVDASSSPLFEAFAEDYRLADSGSGTELSWTVAYRPARAMRIAAPIARPTFRMMARRMSDRLAKFAAQAAAA